MPPSPRVSKLYVSHSVQRMRPPAGPPRLGGAKLGCKVQRAGPPGMPLGPPPSPPWGGGGVAPDPPRPLLPPVVMAAAAAPCRRLAVFPGGQFGRAAVSGRELAPPECLSAPPPARPGGGGVAPDPPRSLLPPVVMAAAAAPCRRLAVFPGGQFGRAAVSGRELAPPERLPDPPLIRPV